MKAFLVFGFAFIACSFFSINVYSQGMEDVFATYDLNQDEHLSLDEFSAYYNATAVAKCETAKPKRSAQFDEMDKNGDGILTRDESPIYISRYLSNPATASLIVNDTLSKEAFTKCPRMSIEYVWKMYDTNADGLISKQEWSAKAAAIFKRNVSE